LFLAFNAVVFTLYKYALSQCTLLNFGSTCCTYRGLLSRNMPREWTTRQFRNVSDLARTARVGRGARMQELIADEQMNDDEAIGRADQQSSAQVRFEQIHYITTSLRDTLLRNLSSGTIQQQGGALEEEQEEDYEQMEEGEQQGQENQGEHVGQEEEQGGEHMRKRRRQEQSSSLVFFTRDDNNHFICDNLVEQATGNTKRNIPHSAKLAATSNHTSRMRHLESYHPRLLKGFFLFFLE
jgi:hypothetical protein